MSLSTHTHTQPQSFKAEISRAESTFSHLKSIGQSKTYAHVENSITQKREERSQKREREKIYFERHCFIWNEGSIKEEGDGVEVINKGEEEKVQRQLNTRQRNGTAEQ